MKREATGLDPMPNAADLLRLKAEREARRNGTSLVLPTRRHRAIAWPVRIRLPWSLLVSDDAKYGVVNGRILLTARYRNAKAAIAARVHEQLGDVEAAAIPLAISALVYLPDNRIHDVCNFSKCVHDALEGVVYVKDQWLHDVHWKRAGVDVDAPRAEITLTPIGG